MAIVEAIFGCDRRFPQPLRQVTWLATMVESVLKVYRQNCNKYEGYALILKEISC